VVVIAAIAIAVAVPTVALVAIGGTSLEPLEQRSALTSQMRFAASMQDMRTVVLLHRQLAMEKSRRRPWLRLPARRSIRRPVWRRGWHGYARWPLDRVLRVVTLLAATAGLAYAARSTHLLIVFGGIALEYPSVEEDFRLVRFESVRIVGAHATEKSPHAPLLSALTSFLEFARTEPSSGLSPAQLRAMEQSTKRYPYAASLVRYASALSLNGQRDEARRTFVKIRYIYGDKMYVRLKDDLHDRVQDGELRLAQLDADRPELASLSP
jgi:hypothetical protein